ncbi:MAG: TonB-dependent receptor [Alkalimonas sp.]|nr:TonB-dependent receptor [Alkalimonas sp.]
MYTNNKLSKAVRLAIAFGAASATAFTAHTVAADEEASARVERIEVTGSRLRRTDLETASPITVVDRASIDAGGFRNLGEILTTLNQADALGLTNVTNDTNGNDGTQTISLRGIGSSRTLVLVDGRRWLALGGGQVDISQIPVAAVERIEVLADGASAIYGSDAIGGVINIITRSDYEGFEIDASYGGNFEGDGETMAYGFSLGVSNARSNLFVNFSRTEQKAIGAGDRDISAVPLANTDLYLSAFGEYGIFFADGAYYSLDPAREIAGLAPGDRTVDDFVLSSAIYGVSDDRPDTRFNYAPENYLMTPSERTAVFVKASHELTDNVRAFGQFTFNQRKSNTQIASVPVTNYFSGPQWQIPISEDNVFNPFGQDILGSGFRMSPAGPRDRYQDYDTYFGTVGFEGDFEIGDMPFYWDVAYSRGESSRHSRGENYVNLGRLRNGLGPSFVNADGELRCGTADAPIANCVPVNFFNGITGMTPEMVDYITYTQHEKTEARVRNLTANISTDLFELPAGVVSMAAGVELREDAFNNVPDSVVQSGLGSDNFRETTQGAKKAEEGYVEFAVPVLRDLPGAQNLELSLAMRYSKFTNDGLVGSTPVTESFSNNSGKVGFTYVPFEGLMLRGNYAQTFRAPSVSDLFGGGAESFGAAVDLCSNSPAAGFAYSELTAEQQARCASVFGIGPDGAPQPTSQIRQLVGGNPFLQPESGNTKTLGFVYNPDFIDGFDMSLDWFKISLKDVLSSVAANTIMRNCIVEGDDTACGFIERSGTGEVQTIRRSSFNLASVEVEGLDLSANYRYETDNMGTFAVRVNSTYTMSAKTTLGQLSDAQSVVGRAVGAFGGPTWRLRSNIATVWRYDDLDVNWTIRHTSSLTENCAAGEVAAGICNNTVQNPDGSNNVGDSFNRIGSVFYHDVSVGYELPWNASIRVGARNVFRKDPPISLSAFANSFLQNYDIPGGTYFMTYRQQF